MRDDAPWELPDEGLVAYDWYRAKAKRLHGSRPTTLAAESGAGTATETGALGYEVDLGYLEDALILLAPVSHGWAVFGREDKYLGPAAVTRVEARPFDLSLVVIESGPILFWSDDGVVSCDDARCEDLGDGLFRLAFEPGARELRIRIRREHN